MNATYSVNCVNPVGLGSEDNPPILVPHSLLELTLSQCNNIRTTENRLLFWFRIDSYPYTDDSEEEWRQMSYAKFHVITKARKTIAETLDWLAKNKFVNVKRVTFLDGNTVKDYKPEEEACKYSTVGAGDLVDYSLWSKSYWSEFGASTDNDYLSNVTRLNLGLLTEISKEKLVYSDKKEENRKKTRDIHSRFNLLKNTGHVGRGFKVNRLFSPWVGASSLVRKRFQLDGCDIVSIDLKAAQPTLIAAMADDTKLLADCKSDALYLGIASLLSISRDEAKKPFMAYAYGKNRGNWFGHKDAYVVQEWMKKRYPKAAGFVMKEKKNKGYRQLSCDLQDKEAELFVDGMLGDLTHEGLPALSVHDALYVRRQDLNRATEIARKHLDKFIPNEQYKLDQDNITER